MTTAVRESPLLRRCKDAVARVSRRYPVVSAGVFGSVARGTYGPGSDVDIFAVFDDGVSLLTKGLYQQVLEDEIGVSVHLSTPSTGSRVDSLRASNAMR